MTNSEIMKSFTGDLGFTVAFLIGALAINVFMGGKVLKWYLLLVFLSMLVTNADQLKTFLKGVKG